jgi:hypothetical protein
MKIQSMETLEEGITERERNASSIAAHDERQTRRFTFHFSDRSRPNHSRVEQPLLKDQEYLDEQTIDEPSRAEDQHVPAMCGEGVIT